MTDKRIRIFLRRIAEGLTCKKIALIMLGAAVCSFGIHNIHQQTGITEGGVIGLMLLCEHWLGISPAVITPVLDIFCYMLAFRYLGGGFIKISVVSTLSVSLFYKLWEFFPHMLPDLSAYPLAASVCGGAFVGVGGRAYCASGRLKRRRRRAGAYHFQADALAFIQGIYVYRLCSAWSFADLYSFFPHCIFCYYGDRFLFHH